MSVSTEIPVGERGMTLLAEVMTLPAGVTASAVLVLVCYDVFGYFEMVLF